MGFFSGLLLLYINTFFPPIGPIVRKGLFTPAAGLGLLWFFFHRLNVHIWRKEFEASKQLPEVMIDVAEIFLLGKMPKLKKYPNSSPGFWQLTYGLFFILFFGGTKGWDEIVDWVGRGWDLVLVWWMGREELERVREERAERVREEIRGDVQRTRSEREEAWRLWREKAIEEWEEKSREEKRKEELEVEKRVWEDRMRNEERELVERRRRGREGKSGERTESARRTKST